MAENCTHNCSTCSSNCASKDKESFLAPLHELSSVKHVIAVASGKGGVGKSTVTSLLAVAMARKGYNTAILDADITGPSIPKAFGITGKVRADETGLMLPEMSCGGVSILSANMMLPNEDDPVIWRGALIAGAVKQFWQEALWNEVDYMFVDMPPGTGDVPLTVFQSLPIDGTVIVTTPQKLVSMVVKKAVKMAEKMSIPVLGLVENMSYLKWPDCGKTLEIFGKSTVAEMAKEYGIDAVAKLPIDPAVAELEDTGSIEKADVTALDAVVSAIERL